MKAYIIVDVKITDPELFEEYKKQTPASLLPYGGKFMARGGSVETLEGDWTPGRIVILEFPSEKNARDWWNSKEYSPAKLIRQRAANTQIILVDGVE